MEERNSKKRENQTKSTVYQYESIDESFKEPKQSHYSYPNDVFWAIDGMKCEY